MMMFILNISSSCSDPGLAIILATIKKFMNILWIIGPILAIVGAGIALFKLLSNPDEKKYKSLFRNILIALIMLFLLPAIVNAVMGLLDGKFDFATCWNQAEAISQTSSQGSTYIDPQKDKTTIYTDPEEFNDTTRTKSTSVSESASFTDNTNTVVTASEVTTKKLFL